MSAVAKPKYRDQKPRIARHLQRAPDEISLEARNKNELAEEIGTTDRFCERCLKLAECQWRTGKTLSWICYECVE